MHNVDTTLMHSEPGIEKYYMQGGKGSSGNFYLQHSWSILAVAELWLWWQWYRRDGDLRNLHEWSWHMETDHPHIMNVVIPMKM